MSVTAEQVVAKVGGDIVGGNVVSNGVYLGTMVEGVFVLTDEGLARLHEADAPELPKPRRGKGPVSDAVGVTDSLKIDLE